jgi:RNA polymerase sigma factor (sigma-70 family)
MTTPEHPFFSDESFKCLFDNYKNRLCGYVLGITHSHYTAEEITQEIFIKLWLCRDVLNQVDNLDGYIFTIARNKKMNHLRKAAYDVRLLKELQEWGLSAGSGNNVEERAMAGEYDQLLQGALGPGIAGLDITDISDVLYREKKAKDCMVNPLHPNDYMARWYAQGLVALFCP